MSSSTHLITLSVLREYLRKKPVLRFSRLAGMLTMFVMLIIAITPTTNQTYYNIISGKFINWDGRSYNYDENYRYLFSGIASACFWSQTYWNGWRWDSAVTYLLLISSYVARAAALVGPSETFFRRNIRERLLSSLEKALDRKVKQIRDCVDRQLQASLSQRMSYCTYLATYTVILAFLELYTSFLAPLLWVLLNIVWGSLQLLVPRTALARSGLIKEENSFAFGQIIPLMLLALPLVAALEAYYGLSRDHLLNDVVQY